MRQTAENIIRGEAYRNILLCVDTYENGHMTGHSFHPGFGEKSRSYESFVQFLVTMEDLMNEIRFPESFTARRSFLPASEHLSGGVSGDERRAGALATFLIRLLFRQNASWQGTVRWMEQDSEMAFRSVLELTLLIDSTMSDGKRRGKRQDR